MKLYNPNPAGLFTQDCAYRGLSFFLGITWIKAVFELVSFATSRGRVNFTYITNITDYLACKGYDRHRSPRKGMTVGDFGRQVAMPGHCYLIALEKPKHITVVNTELELVDTWDCTEKVVKYYWER